MRLHKAELNNIAMTNKMLADLCYLELELVCMFRSAKILHTVCFVFQEDLMMIISGHDEFKEKLIAKSNPVAANKASEALQTQCSRSSPLPLLLERE